MQRMEIPRPQISGLEFVPTRGRLGFYKSIQKSMPTAPRRPPLSEVHFSAPPPDYDPTPTSNSSGHKNVAKLSNTRGSHDSNHLNNQQTSGRSTEPHYPPPDYNSEPVSKSHNANARP
ncbi:unnamed protein product [Toxocara canis]|uniref:Uncharacterized protein n=1 Tax=Toxocara canis TaxID=6265 RepID=A0A3P7GDA9_TOXCA|nr:unnamed protein product [Toxocara canis]